MKKLSLLLISLLGVMAFAQENSLSLKYGLTSLKVDGGTKFENSTLSLDGVYDLGYPINPRLDLAYVSSPIYFASSNSNNNHGWGGADSLLQFAISGQYQTSTDYKLSPYVFGGIGYERVNHSVKCFSSNPFLQLGTGLKYALNEQVNLLGEFKALQMLGGDNQDNELLFSLGLNFPFNAPLVQAPVVNTPNAIQTINQTSTLKDSDHDGVADEADLCPNTVLKKDDMVDKNGCKIQIILDSDNDGITDDVDACKFTPFELRKSVDKSGCAKGEKASASQTEKNFADMGDTINLHIKFDSNMAKIKSEYQKKIKDFAIYIKSLGANTIVTINGYTDSSGDEAKNRKLSSERAFAVRKALIKAGLKPTQVRAYGLGSINPIAPNDTAEGRSKNRRIEAVIEK
jgi:outer membrane protein OmpA-like peptidoglycan-associated protein/opacity protein-like surface antigen